MSFNLKSESKYLLILDNIITLLNKICTRLFFVTMFSLHVNFIKGPDRDIKLKHNFLLSTQTNIYWLDKQHRKPTTQ